VHLVDPTGAKVVGQDDDKRALGTRAPITIPQGPNQRRSLDFASDALSNGRRFRILVVVDDFTHE
jgi:putative transposase